MKYFMIVLYVFTIVMPLYPKDAKELEEIIQSIFDSKIEGKETPEIPGIQKKNDGKKSIDIEKQKEKNTPAPPSPDEILLKSGIQQFEASIYDSAVKILNELKNKYPNSPYKDQASIWIAKILASQNKNDPAINELKSISEESGEYPLALFNIGEIQMKEKNSSAAIENFYKVASLFPEHELADNAYIKTAAVYIDENKGSHALNFLLKVIKYYDDRETLDEVYYLLGSIFESDPILKDFSIARKIYKIFLRKANEEKLAVFHDSPLRKKVEKKLNYIESAFFGLEN